MCKFHSKILYSHRKKKKMRAIKKLHKSQITKKLTNNVHKSILLRSYPINLQHKNFSTTRMIKHEDHTTTKQSDNPENYSLAKVNSLGSMVGVFKGFFGSMVGLGGG